MTDPDIQQDQLPPEGMSRLVMLWGACCLSPVLYLGIAALIKRSFMPQEGWFPVEPFTMSRLMIGLVVWVVLLQLLHLVFRLRVRSRLELLADDTDAFYRLLTRRTVVLIALSEAAVATGFCLFLLQGDYKPIFISGIAAMLLYAQSHPRLSLPTSPA